MIDAIEVHIHIPEQNTEEAIAGGLVRLTEAISGVDPGKVAHGFLGGQFGYGANFSNAVFEMRPFDWDPECTCGMTALGDQWHRENQHRPYCYQVELEAAEIAACLEPWEAREIAWPEYDDAEMMEESIYSALCEKFNVPSSLQGVSGHCTCGFQRACIAWFDEHPHALDCRLELPNFLHRSTRLRVGWYKYIGRDMTVTSPGGAVDVSAIIAECIRSVIGGA